MATNASFASNSIQTSTINTQDIDHFSGPKKKKGIAAIAGANKSAWASSLWQEKTIRVKGTLKGSSIAVLDALIDTFKGYFIDGEQNFDVDYNGSTRRYLCVADEPVIKRDKGLSLAEFTVDLTCTRPFGFDTSNTTIISAAGRTTGINNDAHTFGGNADRQHPIITYTLTAVTGGTGATVFYTNNATGQQIAVTRTWSNGDILVIDTVTPSVKVNGVEVEFTGAFPTFKVGSGTLGYSDTFTTRTYTVVAVYAKRWK